MADDFDPENIDAIMKSLQNGVPTTAPARKKPVQPIELDGLKVAPHDRVPTFEHPVVKEQPQNAHAPAKKVTAEKAFDKVAAEYQRAFKAFLDKDFIESGYAISDPEQPVNTKRLIADKTAKARSAAYHETIDNLAGGRKSHPNGFILDIILNDNEALEEMKEIAALQPDNKEYQQTYEAIKNTVESKTYKYKNDVLHKTCKQLVEKIYSNEAQFARQVAADSAASQAPSAPVNTPAPAKDDDAIWSSILTPSNTPNAAAPQASTAAPQAPVIVHVNTGNEKKGLGTAATVGLSVAATAAAAAALNYGPQAASDIKDYLNSGKAPNTPAATRPAEHVANAAPAVQTPKGPRRPHIQQPVLVDDEPSAAPAAVAAAANPPAPVDKPAPENAVQAAVMQPKGAGATPAVEKDETPATTGDESPALVDAAKNPRLMNQERVNEFGREVWTYLRNEHPDIAKPIEEATGYDGASADPVNIKKITAYYPVPTLERSRLNSGEIKPEDKMENGNLLLIEIAGKNKGGSQRNFTVPVLMGQTSSAIISQGRYFIHPSKNGEDNVALCDKEGKTDFIGRLACLPLEIPATAIEERNYAIEDSKLHPRPQLQKPVATIKGNLPLLSVSGAGSLRPNMNGVVHIVNYVDNDQVAFNLVPEGVVKGYNPSNDNGIMKTVKQELLLGVPGKPNEREMRLTVIAPGRTVRADVYAHGVDINHPKNFGTPGYTGDGFLPGQLHGVALVGQGAEMRNGRPTQTLTLTQVGPANRPNRGANPGSLQLIAVSKDGATINTNVGEFGGQGGFGVVDTRAKSVEDPIMHPVIADYVHGELGKLYASGYRLLEGQVGQKEKIRGGENSMTVGTIGPQIGSIKADIENGVLTGQHKVLRYHGGDAASIIAAQNEELRVAREFNARNLLPAYKTVQGLEDPSKKKKKGVTKPELPKRTKGQEKTEETKDNAAFLLEESINAPDWTKRTTIQAKAGLNEYEKSERTLDKIEDILAAADLNDHQKDKLREHFTQPDTNKSPAMAHALFSNDKDMADAAYDIAKSLTGTNRNIPGKDSGRGIA